MRYSVAPMMDWTDRHYRYLARLISPSTWLYTEMVTSHAILHGDSRRFLQRNANESPVVLQLGGSEPSDLARAVSIANAYDYQEINLNCGCPSPRVQKGAFGACLMSEPELVADCMSAMAEASEVPVTVKTRIGIDEQDNFEFLCRFVDIISSRSPVERFIIHARKAWLNGLSPKENREKPPLHYDRAIDLKAQFPHLKIELNGGLSCDRALEQHFPTLDGFMIGRQAYHDPYSLSALENESHSQIEIVQRYVDYAGAQLEQGVRMQTLIKPILGLFQGQKGARAWRRYLSEHCKTQDAGIIEQALSCVDSGC